MKIINIIKRDFTKKTFELDKISSAVLKAMKSVGNGNAEDANLISKNVYFTLLDRDKKFTNYVPNVEEIQDIVEQQLMEAKFFEVAKSYIIYRNNQAQKRQRDIFEKRINLKPYEYPELYEYVPAIRHSYWIHSEFNFTSDIQDFKARLSSSERTVTCLVSSSSCKSFPVKTYLLRTPPKAA